MNNNIGIGFRKDFAEDFLQEDGLKAGFVELAPENWMNIGGYWKKVLKQVAQKYPITCHGLSLSIGSPEPLDWGFIEQVKNFLNEYNIEIYSEHLSYTKCNNAHLYELLPVPFREDAALHIASRIKKVQQFLGRKIAIENVSYYTPVAAEMDEADFINLILEEADCNLLLDVNNVYVNSFNHQYNPYEFLDKTNLSRVSYIHMAGHLQVADDLIIDTHGENIIDPVYDLFSYTVSKINPVPVLLERDFNIPEINVLQNELNTLQNITQLHWQNGKNISQINTRLHAAS